MKDQEIINTAHTRGHDIRCFRPTAGVKVNNCLMEGLSLGLVRGHGKSWDRWDLDSLERDAWQVSFRGFITDVHAFLHDRVLLWCKVRQCRCCRVGEMHYAIRNSLFTIGHNFIRDGLHSANGAIHNPSLHVNISCDHYRHPYDKGEGS